METRFRSRRKRYVTRDVQEDEGKAGLKPISMELSSLGSAVKPLGQFITKTEFKGTKYSFRGIVVPKMIDCLMSCSVACRMGLIKKIENVEVFQGLGCLKEGSCELTTFITPFRRYCFRRLPFGITSASEIFMRKMNEVLDGLEGTLAYMDDILVYGKDWEEHDKRLECVMKRLREVDLKLNKEKCFFAQSELKFLGHKFTKSGIEPAGDKVSVILEMPELTSMPLLRQIMGMVHYMGAYLPNLHDITKPLNDLLRSDAVWLWEPAQQEAFNTMKELVSSAQALAYYDIRKPTVVSADASS